MVLYGYFGHEVNVNDGNHVYMRAAKDETNKPLNVYTAMPTLLRQQIGADDGCMVSDYDKIETGRYLKWTEYPVFRFSSDIVNFTNWSQSFEYRKEYNKETRLYDLKNDYLQENPINDDKLEKEMKEKLIKAMKDADCPEEQFERIGLV